jgi:hypothetical protein
MAFSSPTHIPSFELEGEEGSWEAIKEIVERQLLPTLDKLGPSLFLPSGQPIPLTARPALIENSPGWWHRKCPQIVYVVRGEEQIIYQEKLW